MAGQLVPSTGKIRKCAPINYNVRKFQGGELVLYRTTYGTWSSARIDYATGDAAYLVGIGKTLYRDVAASIPDRVDAAALVDKLNAIEAKTAAEIIGLRSAMRGKVLDMVEGARLGHIAPLMP